MIKLMKLIANVKSHLGILLCFFWIGCSIEGDISKSLESIYQYELAEYEQLQERLVNFVNESSSSAINRSISSKIPQLDSLLVSTNGMVDAAKSKEEIQSIILNWKREIEDLNNTTISTMQIPARNVEVYRIFSKLKLLQGSKQLLEFLSMEVNSMPIQFDELKLIVVPEKSAVKVGE